MNIKSILPIVYIEGFERFAYLGFTSTFVFYLIDIFSFSKGAASSLSSSFGAGIYLFGMLGAYLGDRYLGSKKASFYGLICLCFGYLFCAFANLISFIIGIFLIFCGSLLIKSNLTNLLVLNSSDKRELIFSIFYIFVNIGCFLGQLILGYIGQNHSYNLSYFFAFMSLILAICVFVKNQNKIKDDFVCDDKNFIFYVVLFFVISGLLILVLPLDYLRIIISLLSILTPFVIYFNIYFKSGKNDNFKLLGLYYLYAIVFYMLIFQSFNTINILARQKAIFEIFGFIIPSSWYSSFMFFISIFFSIYMSKYLKNHNINETKYFAFAVILSALAFILLGIISSQSSIFGFYFLLIYFLLGVAQLLVGSIGLSITSKLSLSGYETRAMGLWFLCSAAAQGLESFIVKYIDEIGLEYYFGIQGIFVLFVSLILLAASKKLNNFINTI